MTDGRSEAILEVNSILVSRIDDANDRTRALRKEIASILTRDSFVLLL